MGNHYKLAVIGECMAELSGSLFGDMKQGFGGDTMNTAIYLKLCRSEDLQVSFVSVMGQDKLSEVMVDKWRGYGVDTEFVLTDSSRTCGLYMIQNDDDGERHFQYWRNDSAARYIMRHKDIEHTFEKLRGFDGVFLSGISLAILPPNERLELIDRLAELTNEGVKVIFDGNFRPQLWRSLEEAQLAYAKILEYCQLALVTFDDEALLWGDRSVEQTIGRLQSFGIPEIVTKDGANGCFYTDADGTVHIPTTPVAQVVDTTAAGDSFNAGFLAGWTKNASPSHCARLGNQVAGQVIQQRGAIVALDTKLLEV